MKKEKKGKKKWIHQNFVSYMFSTATKIHLEL